MVNHDVLDDSVLKEENKDRVTSVERLADRSWDRDNISQRVSEVQNTADIIETILQDINEQLKNIPTQEELEEEWESYLERKPTDNRGNVKEYPRAFSDAKDEKIELLLREAIWQARLKELKGFALKKVAEKFDMLLEEYRTARLHESLEEVIENKAEHFASQEVKEMTQEMRNQVNSVEKFGQAVREESKSLWRMVERLAEEDSNGLTSEELQEIRDLKSAISDFVKSNGVLTLDSEELESDSALSSREVAADAAAESVVGSDESEASSEESDRQIFEVKGKSVREQFEALESLAESFEPLENDWTQSQVAEHTDVTPAALFKDDGIIDRVNAEDLFPAVDVRD